MTELRAGAFGDADEDTATVAFIPVDEDLWAHYVEQAKGNLAFQQRLDFVARWGALLQEQSKSQPLDKELAEKIFNQLNPGVDIQVAKGDCIKLLAPVLSRWDSDALFKAYDTELHAEAA